MDFLWILFLIFLFSNVVPWIKEKLGKAQSEIEAQQNKAENVPEVIKNLYESKDAERVLTRKKLSEERKNGSDTYEMYSETESSLKASRLNEFKPSSHLEGRTFTPDLKGSSGLTITNLDSKRTEDGSIDLLDDIENDDERIAFLRRTMVMKEVLDRKF